LPPFRLILRLAAFLTAAAISWEPEGPTGTEPVITTISQPDSSAAQTASAESAALYASSTPPQNMPVPFFHSSSRNHTTPPVEPLQIIVNSDRLMCRGVAGNLEPALLSGHVVLNLNEAVNIKDISLEFVGKARIPNDSRSSCVYIVTSRMWRRTLNGLINSIDNRPPYTLLFSATAGLSCQMRSICIPSRSACRIRTPISMLTIIATFVLQEGRHVFPFQLELDAALPASMTCPHVGSGAEVYYNLRATAVRSTFSSNFHAVKPMFITKAFSPESIEFTQSLEVEVSQHDMLRRGGDTPAFFTLSQFPNFIRNRIHGRGRSCILS
jgi:hypothetical protein